MVHDRKNNIFETFAKKVARVSGYAPTFIAAFALVLIWFVSGSLFNYSDTWQLVINTGTTIVTFLMVFLIQNTQNSDTEALHLKLDELLRVTKGAHTALLDLEELTQEELDAYKEKYDALAKEARKRLKRGQSDTDIPTFKSIIL